MNRVSVTAEPSYISSTPDLSDAEKYSLLLFVRKI